MKATITDGKLAIDMQEIVESLSDDDKRTLSQYAVFNEELFEGILQTVVDGTCWDGGWWIGDMAERLRAKLLPLLPDVVRELVEDLANRRDQASARYRNICDILFELERHWPPEVAKGKDDRDGYGSEAYTRWNAADAEAFLAEKLGPAWEKYKEEAAAKEKPTEAPPKTV